VAQKITQIIYFNSHGRRRQQHPTTPEATARTHLLQPTLSTYAERKQAGIIFISLLTTGIHSAGCQPAAITGCGGRRMNN